MPQIGVHASCLRFWQNRAFFLMLLSRAFLRLGLFPESMRAPDGREGAARVLFSDPFHQSAISISKAAGIKTASAGLLLVKTVAV